MKRHLILATILLLVVGCSSEKQTVSTVTERKDSVTQPKKRDEWEPQIKRVRGCDYVFFHHWSPYYSETATMLHAGDCPNPIHSGRQ